jgi:hypothetical protein
MVVLTAIANYGIHDIKPFVCSLNKSGYTGKKIAVIYNLDKMTIDFLKINGWELYKGQLNEHVILQRFKDINYLLNNILPINEDIPILWLDIKDVIFQRNPEDWLVTNVTQENPLLAFSECVKLGDDDWATVNCGTSFPDEWDTLKHNISYCAGTIAGLKKNISILFADIYELSKLGKNKSQLADQAAFNVLLRSEKFNGITNFVEQASGFVTNLGTVLIKKDFFGDKLLEATPIISGKTVINSETNQPFYIVHQYDRSPELKEVIINAYTD